jgi:YbbR domain-containing protein
MKNALFNDLGLKLVALLLAFGLWLYVGTHQVLERRVELKLVFTDLPAQAALAPDVTSTLTVLLVGRKDRIGALEARDLRATVSLLGVPVPVKDYPVKVQIAGIPKGVAADIPPLLVGLNAEKPIPKPAPKKPRVVLRRR